VAQKSAGAVSSPGRKQTKRKDIAISTKRLVLAESAYRCGNPRCNHILTLELHHILWVKDSGGDGAENLLALCANCHGLHTAGYITQDAITHWKGLLLALNHAFDRESIDLLLFLYQPATTITMYYSADGVLKFARLIAHGLARLGESMAFVRNVAQSSHTVVITDKGRMLVETWLAGDQERYQRLLNEPDFLSDP